MVSHSETELPFEQQIYRVLFVVELCFINVVGSEEAVKVVFSEFDYFLSVNIDVESKQLFSLSKGYSQMSNTVGKP